MLWLADEERRNTLKDAWRGHRPSAKALSLSASMLGFKDFHCARIILSGIEVMHMIRKQQIETEDGTHPCAAKPLYSMIT
jgi:transposase-like protein